jgi:hypothetical protein
MPCYTVNQKYLAERNIQYLVDIKKTGVCKSSGRFKQALLCFDHPSPDCFQSTYSEKAFTYMVCAKKGFRQRSFQGSKPQRNSKSHFPERAALRKSTLQNPLSVTGYILDSVNLLPHRNARASARRCSSPASLPRHPQDDITVGQADDTARERASRCLMCDDKPTAGEIA